MICRSYNQVPSPICHHWNDCKFSREFTGVNLRHLMYKYRFVMKLLQTQSSVAIITTTRCCCSGNIKVNLWNDLQIKISFSKLYAQASLVGMLNEVNHCAEWKRHALRVVNVFKEKLRRNCNQSRINARCASVTHITLEIHQKVKKAEILTKKFYSLILFLC